MTMLDILSDLSSRLHDKVAVMSGSDSLTYGQLLSKVEAEAERLSREEQVKPHMLYQFRASQDVAYIVRFLALHVTGAICVPVDTLLPLPAFSHPDASDVLFTTGSTSEPKGVLLSFDAVLADAENLIKAHRYHQGITFVICGPIHHFGAWSKVMPTLLTGGTLVILDGLKDMELLFQVLGSTEHTATFLVPSALKMLMQLNSERLSSLAHNIEFIETGAAPFTATDMEALRQLLPYTRLYNTYASTETGVVCTYPFHLPSAEPDRAPESLDAQCRERCVGPAMQHAHVRLTDDGRIAVSGRMIMTGYMHQPDVPVTEVVTSDIGMLDEEQRLYIVGRESDFINVGGLKVAPAEVEAVVTAVPWLKECVCIPHPHPLMGQVPELLVVCRDEDYDRKALIAHLKKHLEPHKIPLLYRRVDAIAKTYNGKIDRKSYRDGSH